MTRYAASVIDSLSSGESLIAGLDGGYVVTQSGSGSPSATINLRAVDDLITVASSATVTGEFIDESCCNNAGNAYLLTNASSTTRTLRSITQSSGAISVTSVGTFTVPTGGGNLDASFLDPADTQVLVRYSAIADFSAVNTGTGALDWTSVHTGHSLTALACMGSDRYLAACSTHSDVELWDGATDTLLDSLARDGNRSATEVITPITATSALYAIEVSGSDPNTVRLGLLSTTGDALSFTWGPTDKVTAWTTGTPTDRFVVASAWGTRAVVGPGRRIYSGTYLSMPVYLVDCATGQVSASTADTSVGYGVYDGELWWSGSDAFSFHDYHTYATITTWSVSPATTPILRQRQSPKRTPSRVRGIDLRQRQTPYIG